MKKRTSIALKTIVTVLQTIALIMSFIPKWVRYWGTFTAEYNLYQGGCVFLAGVVYAICAVAILIFLWTNIRKSYFVFTVIQTVVIIANHYIVTKTFYWTIDEFGVAHTLMICVSFGIIWFMYLMGDSKTDEKNVKMKKNDENLRNELEELKKIYELNLITQEEYEKKKAQILKI